MYPEHGLQYIVSHTDLPCSGISSTDGKHADVESVSSDNQLSNLSDIYQLEFQVSAQHMHTNLQG